MQVGDVVSHYRVTAFLGAGGMGEVFKAEDLRLQRPVALKFLPAALGRDEQAKQRLLVEARAISTLDHPNICTLHEIDETADGRLFLAMAAYEGETLRQRLERGPLAPDDASEILLQVARGVAAAHDAGIIHRDIKPGNIFLCAPGGSRRAETPQALPLHSARTADPARVKLLDFGIAKLSTDLGLTRTGTTVGTLAYMSPERIAGSPADARSDVWSLGVVLYEALAGSLPFAGDDEVALFRAIVDGTPRPIGQIRPDVPPAVAALVDRALQKDPAARLASAAEFAAALDAAASAARTTTHVHTRRPGLGRRGAVLVAVGVLAAGTAVAWFAVRAARDRAAAAAVAEMTRLVETEQHAAAFRRLHTLPASQARHPDVARARRDLFFPLRVDTVPSGARVEVKGYGEPDAPWIALGSSPVETEGTIGAFRWRVAREGFETFEGTGIAQNPLGEIGFTLAAAGTSPPGMVPVPGGAVAGVGQLPDFFVDRYEVTNKAFKAFVDAGGYRDPKYWQEPFEKDGRTLTWPEAMAEFRDATGRPGPSTWELGTFPEGQEDWPVGGISWYEAAAYARFAGRSLPTVHHWRLAAAMGIHSAILEWSNFGGKGPARVGEHRGLGPYGTYDMAGNVKEWCLNAAGGRRYILGGAWNEPNYQYQQPDGRLPFDRSPNNGMRLMIAPDPTRVPAAAAGPVERLARDYARERPVGDDVFQALASVYSYDPVDLAATVESVDDADASWRVERVSYNAAYGGERVTAYLFLPKNASPPYQTVVYFPHAGGFALRSFQLAEMAYLGFVVKAGRALLFPMCKGTYERRLPARLAGISEYRDMTIQQVKDVRRSVDYLLTRPDIAHDRLAYFGVSLGANVAPMVLSVERRFTTAVLWSGGLPATARPAEIDPINFAPRVTLPLLMLNGRDDFTFPPATSQEPMFRLFGTPPDQKRRAMYEGGHVFPFSRLIKDTLDWLDAHLGAPAPRTRNP
jgi:dienelactone hydrolase